MECILDPYILTLPAPGSDASRWTEYAENLHMWAGEIKRKTHKFWLSWRVYEALDALGRYPTWDNLQSLSHHLPSDIPYDIRTLFASCERALTEPCFLEDLAEDEAHEVDFDETEVIPESILQRLPAKVGDALQQALVDSAIISHQDLHDVFSELLFASVPNGFDDAHLRVRVEAYDAAVDKIEAIEETWPIVTSSKQIDTIEGILEFWQDTDRALEWAKQELQTQRVEPQNAWPQLEVRPEFNQSIMRLRLHKKPKQLRELFIEIAKMMWGVTPRYKHAKGVNRKKNKHHAIKDHKDHVMRRPSDLARAYRLNVFGDYRVQYWLKGNGEVELVNVVKGHEPKDMQLT